MNESEISSTKCITKNVIQMDVHNICYLKKEVRHNFIALYTNTWFTHATFQIVTRNMNV